ncbi:MAG: hypothetical protein J6N72_00615 [Psychrobacter sp.]|nr:hypothetical protein [Psychrobacter sp.]
MNNSQERSPKTITNYFDLKKCLIVAIVSLSILIILTVFYVLSLFGYLYNPMAEPNQLAVLTLVTIFSFLLAWSISRFTEISIDDYTNNHNNKPPNIIMKNMRSSGVYSLIVVMVFLSLLAIISIEIVYLFAVDMLIKNINLLKYGTLLILALLGLKYTNNTYKIYMENISRMR